jgi:tryptophanyl-tRNA synthetase
MNKILLSGIQPTGRPHIGNYFGAMKQFVDLQDKYDTRVFIADLHALTSMALIPSGQADSKQLKENIIGVALDYLAIGLDPKKCLIFKQSDVPQVTELCWLFDCITTMPYLMRAHSFKDAEAKSKDISVGTFNYPMLMAADILIHDSNVVPVGQDQKQHVEFARDTVEKFNRIFGETFNMPEPLILESVAIVPGTDGQKMSKSYNNTIPLFATDEEIQKAVMGIVTDSSGGIPKNVYAMHSLFRTKEELNKIYAENEGKYKILKDLLIEDMTNFIRPLREKRSELEKDLPAVLAMLKENGEKVREIAETKMKEIREKVGVSLY